MSWANPFEFKLSFDELEAMSPEEVDIRIDYGRAPVRSVAQLREHISITRGQYKDPPFYLRLRSDEARDLLDDLARMSCSAVATLADMKRPDDIPPEGEYMGAMYGLHLIRDS